jgi:tRNA U34 5-methylaminomethyl-2-thiouridine-forming methyltransferase MnmC
MPGVNEHIPQILMTADGSPTLYVPALDETYHSRHGAVQESRPVFIEAGLKAVNRKSLRILEIGFGTGLNALLTAGECALSGLQVHYRTLETYPLPREVYAHLSFESAGPDDRLLAMHEASWNISAEIAPGFLLEKIHTPVQQLSLPPDSVDLIYYDAFGPRAQPEMWTREIFSALLEMSSPGAVWVSYCSRGQVRRDLQSAGWKVEKLPGPRGKREMMRAYRPDQPA